MQAQKLACSTDNPADSLHVYALTQFSVLLEKYSEGRLSCQIYFRGSEEFPAIRGEEVNVNMMMLGNETAAIDVTVVAAGNLSLKASILEFLMLPYLFPEFEAAQRLFGSDFVRDELNSVLEEKHNIRAIGWLIGGYRHMTNGKLPITTIDQMKGVNIRVPRNHIMKDTYEAFGAIATPMNWRDVPQALFYGEIDGQENPYNVVVSNKFWAANQKYLTKNGPFLWVGPILMRSNLYQGLDETLRKAVDRAGFEAAQMQWQWLLEKNESFITQLAAEGMEILELEDKQKWMDAAQPVKDNAYQLHGYGDTYTRDYVLDKVNAAITGEK